jgi:hypothetical protein
VSGQAIADPAIVAMKSRRRMPTSDSEPCQPDCAMTASKAGNKD